MKYFFLALSLVVAGCSRPANAPSGTSRTFQLVRCAERDLPEFRLGANMTSSEQEQVALCECIWSRLSDHDRNVAVSLRNARPHHSSTVQSFPIRFGKAIGMCTRGT